jgi:hypothetical protein
MYKPRRGLILDWFPLEEDLGMLADVYSCSRRAGSLPFWRLVVVKGTWTVPGNLGKDEMLDPICPSITEIFPYSWSLTVLMIVGAGFELIWGRESPARECPGPIAYSP